MATPAGKPGPVRRRLFQDGQDSHDSLPSSGGDPASPRAKRAKLQPREQAQLLMEYKELKSRAQQRKGAVSELCKRFGVHRAYCAELSERMEDSNRVQPFTPLPRSGRPGKLTPTKSKKMAELMEKNHCKLSLRALSAQMQNVGTSSKGGSLASVQRWTRKLHWRRVQRTSTPMLTEIHKKNRLAWARSHELHDWSSTVDIDEKWFYGTLLTGKLHVPRGAKVPSPPVQSKRFVPKVMFLTAVCKPDPANGFNGKIGCWPITRKRTAKRCSKNLIVPAIRRKMGFKKHVTIQMDNAPPHGDLQALEAAINDRRHGRRMKISFTKQPAQSPDTNLNDLGLFNSMQTSVDKLQGNLQGTQEIIATVKKAWEAVLPATLQKLVETKMLVVSKIIESRGSNDFVLPHSPK
eukprot:m.333581 g.333581  ORF g.333581 m.333581 type:complete len:406 (-) comp55651_c0_seq4:157-1374(-)